MELELTRPSPRSAEHAWELAATIAVSVSPNQYVIGIDTERGRALVHFLVPRRIRSFDDLLP
jgi:hypothetical protein